MIALSVYFPESDSSLPNLERGWNAYGILFCNEKVIFSLLLRQSTGQLEVQCCSLHCLKRLCFSFVLKFKCFFGKHVDTKESYLGFSLYMAKL